MQRTVIFIITFLSIVSAREPEPSFQHFTSNDGLSENTVEYICQDKNGLMWFGTSLGLNKYDGYTFKVYRHDPTDSFSISSNQISELICDSRGRLWIGTYGGGLSRYDYLNQCFINYRHKAFHPEQGHESVAAIEEGNDGALWIGSMNGLEQFDPVSETFTSHPVSQSIFDAYGSFAISDLVMESSTTLWLGTGEKGLFRVNIRDKTFTNFQAHPHSDSLSHNNIMSLAQDSAGRLWIATYGGGLNMYDGIRFWSFTQESDDAYSLASNNLFVLFLDQNNDLMIGAEQGGLHRLDLDSFDPHNPRFIKYEHNNANPRSLSSNNIRSIFRDQTGNLWLGTYKRGINFHARYGKNFIHYISQPNNDNSLAHNLVNTIYEDRRHNIWIGTDGGGVNKFDRQKNQFAVFRHQKGNPKSLAHNHVGDLCEDPFGNLWVATWGGLHLFNRDNHQFTRFLHDPRNINTPCSDHIVDLYVDSRNLMWICTYEGLSVMDLESRAYRHKFAYPDKPGSLSSSWTTCAMEDTAGNVWIGTNSGINMCKATDIDQNRFVFESYLHHQYDQTNSNGKFICDLFVDSRGRLWAASTEGLFWYDAALDTFHVLTTKAGLPSNAICSILEDNQHQLWLGTMRGLSRYDPETGEFFNYLQSDGLQSNEFTHTCACKSHTGELYFGGVNGFNVFHPQEIGDNPQPPHITITEFLIHNRKVSLGEYQSDSENIPSGSGYPEIKIPPNVRVFSIGFAALDYTNPQKNRYMVKLEGFDTEWVKTSTDRRRATYTNLPAGHYTFHVRASNSDGVWSEESMMLPIRVMPPFWQSNWALFVYISIVLAVLFILRQIIVTKTRYDTELKLDHLKIDWFTNVSHEFRTPLTLIIGPLEKLLDSQKTFSVQSRQKLLSVILRNARRLLRLINQVLDFQKMESGSLQLQYESFNIVPFVREIVESFRYVAESKNIDLKLTPAVENLRIVGDPEKLDKIIYNLVSNALKYTPDGGEIEITICQRDSVESLRRKYPHEYEALFQPVPAKRWSVPQLCEIKVRDNGCGIAPEHQSSIFNLFYQGKNRAAHGHPGTGVGLAFTKQLVEMHNGAIGVVSRQGEGSTFLVILPLQGQKSAVPEIKRQPVTSADNSAFQNQYALNEHDFNPDGKSIKILIVEDDADMRCFLQDHLSETFTAFTARDGQSALNVVKKQAPDLVISDVMMPGMNGFEMCEKIKSNIATSHIPVILLTARTAEGAQLRGYHIGADAYLKKPFSLPILTARIVNILDNRQRLHEKFRQSFFMEPKDMATTTMDEQFIRRAVHIVEDSLQEETFGVEQLAKAIGMSRANLYRKIQAIAGVAPREFVQQIRLRRAAQLLAQNASTISEIAYLTGFSDPAYFSNCFKKQFGQTPSDFVKSHTVPAE